MESWDDEDFVPPVVAPTVVDVNKWEGEDEDDEVKDNWEDEDEDNEKSEETRAEEAKKKKKPLAERIAEKERKKREEMERRLREMEEEDVSPEEKLKRQKESDLKLALETTFGGSPENGIGGLLLPSTKEEFEDFTETLSKKLLPLSKSIEYPAFTEGLLRNLCATMTSLDIKKIKTTLDNLYLEKQKMEKGDKPKKSKGKGKARLKLEGDNSDSSTFANSQVVKKTRTETSGSLEEALAAKKVTITLEGFPKVKMNVEQLTALRASIEEAQEDIPEELWPISFTRCNYKSGSMVVTCEDAKSARWLMEAVPILHPWKGARLQAKQEDVIPNFCVCRAFFPDKGGQKLETERVLKKLRVSNRGLNTSLWTVNKCIPLEKGHIWYFSMDKVSRKVLGDLSMVASFGMKRLKFSEIGSAKKKNHAVIAATPSTSLAFKETGKEADKNEDVPEATATCQSEPMEEEIIDLCSYED